MVSLAAVICLTGMKCTDLIMSFCTERNLEKSPSLPGTKGSG